MSAIVGMDPRAIPAGLDYPFVGWGKGNRGGAQWHRPLLRTATPNDLDAIYEIETRCFKEKRFRRDHVDWILRNERCRTLVEEDQGRLLGAAMLLFESQACRILSVAVVSEARRQGIASRMMQAAQRLAEGYRCTMVRLEVSTQNHAAIAFYRNLGYKTDGVLYGYYSWGEDAYSMILPLPVATDGADASRVRST